MALAACVTLLCQVEFLIEQMERYQRAHPSSFPIDPSTGLPSQDNTTIGSINYFDRFSQTPLDEAVRRYDAGQGAALIDLLKKHGASVSRDFELGMQLCKAGVNADLKELEAIFEQLKGTDGLGLSTADWDGRTALHLASEGPIGIGPGSQHVSCVQWLLEHKADPNCRDLNGNTPLQCAQQALGEEWGEMAREVMNSIEQHGLNSIARVQHASRMPSQLQDLDPLSSSTAMTTATTSQEGLTAPLL